MDHSFSDDVEYDILLIPGGQGTRDLVNDAGFIDSLKAACGKADIIATVCTGSGLLARTGILDDKEATSNKTAWSWALEQSSKVKWNVEPHWVDLVDAEAQTGIITSAGVSAGIDMALALIAKLDGDQVAENASVIMEYTRPCQRRVFLFGRKGVKFVGRISGEEIPDVCAPDSYRHVESALSVILIAPEPDVQIY